MINLLAEINLVNTVIAATLLLETSLFDILIVLTLGWAIYRGYKRGSIVHSVALLVLLGGVFMAAYLSYKIYGVINYRSRVQLVHLPVIIFSILYVGVVYGAHFVADKVTGNIGEDAKGRTNKLLGILVNIGKYLFMISIVLMFIFKLDATYNFISPEEKKETSLYYPVLKVAPTVFRILRFPEINPIPDFKPIEYQDSTERYERRKMPKIDENQ